MVTVAFIRCFSCFSWFSYCRGNCICAGQGNTVVSHFVVQRGDFTVAIVCVPCGPRRSLIYAWAWGFCVCWKLSVAEKVKPDCCYTPAVVSISDRLRCLGHCPVLRSTAPLHMYIPFVCKALWAKSCYGHCTIEVLRIIIIITFKEVKGTGHCQHVLSKN